MENLFVKLFIKNKDNVKDERVRRQYGVLASVFGIISNAIVCTIKIIVGLLSSTISILADGINNLADALSSFVALFGFKISGKKADKKHPYGHQRMEYIAAFVVSVIIVVLGVQLIINSIDKIKNPGEISSKFWLNVSILGGAILIKAYQAFFNYKIGKRIDSQALRATAADSRNDCISTLVVLVGYIISYYTKVNLDGYFGLAVGVFICISGFKLVFESASPLLGEAPDPELIEKFEALVLKYDCVLGIHDLEIHSYGPSKIYASCHVEVDSKGDLIEMHDSIDQIEHECKAKLGILTTLHLDPILVGDIKTNEMRSFVEQILLENLPFKWSIHDFRIVTGPTHTNLIFDVVVPCDIKETNEEVEELIKELIHSKDESVFVVVNIDIDLNNILDDSNR